MKDTDSHRGILAAAEFVKQCDRVVREGRFDRKTAGSEFMKYGYALLFEMTLEEADRAIRSMLAMYDRGFIDRTSVTKN